MKNIISILFVILFFQSCQYFEKNVPNKDELLKKELEKVNWNQVDELPNVSLCDSLADKELKKACFFNFLSQTIKEKLSPDSIRTLYPKIDILELKIEISADAQLKFNTQKTEENYKIDSLLQIHLADFPMVEPAIKRGIKVKSEFILPVILNTKKQ
jgi:hypothetical protein